MMGRRVHEIVGREVELEAIEGWLDGPRQIAALIEGEAGVGKPTLAQVSHPSDSESAWYVDSDELIA
jgi:DNA-binding NtrC family response regulator